MAGLDFHKHLLDTDSNGNDVEGNNALKVKAVKEVIKETKMNIEDQYAEVLQGLTAIDLLNIIKNKFETPSGFKSRKAIDRTDFGYAMIVQASMKMLGYDPGPIDADYGKNTRQAVWDFQEEQKKNHPDKIINDKPIMVDGLCGPQTFSMIAEQLAGKGVQEEVVKKPEVPVTPTVEPKTEVTPAVEPKKEVTPAVEPKTEVKPAVEPKTEVTPVVETKTEVTPAVEPKTEVKPAVEPKKEVTAEKISKSTDPEKQIALERAKHTMQLLKDQAISSLKSMNPEFKDKDDDKIFGDLKAKWEKRITDAQDTEGVFKAIESIQKELTKINTEKKFTYVNEKGKVKKEKINKKLTLDTSLDMQEYKSASEKALLYKMNAPVTIDAKTQELREKVKTSGEELSTATIAYKSASETLAGLFEKQATVEGDLVTLQSEYNTITSDLNADSKNDSSIAPTERIKNLKIQQTDLSNKIKQTNTILDSLRITQIPTQQTEVNLLGDELKNKTGLYTTDIQTLKTHEQDQQKLVANRVEDKVIAYTDIAKNSVIATGQEWSSIQGTITTAQNDYQSIRFSIPDEQKSQDDITKMQQLEKTISDETTNINKKIDTWIKNFTQQGITIQSVYAMHEYDARTNKEQVQANKQVVQNAHDELGIQVSTLETTIKTINAQLVDKNTSVDQIPILSSKNSQLITLQDALLVQQRSLEQKINELQVEEDKFNARETAANNAYAFTDVVLQQRILQFDEERTQQSVKHEINTQVNLGKQKESNNKEIATLSETKIGLLSDLTAKEIIFANAKKALGDAPKDQSLLQAFKKSAEEFTLVKKKVNENQQALDKYAALNTAIDTAVVESKTRQAAAEKQRDGYIKQRKDLDAQANDLNTKGTHKDLPNQQPATYLATNLPPAFPFEQK